MSAQVMARSPLSAAFLLHVCLEIPFAIQGAFWPRYLPFLDMTNSTLTMVKLYSALSLATCVAAFLCYGLPEFMPGKRAFAIQLVIYHSVCSTILYNSPRFIPMSFGAFFEQFKITPENVWGTFHGLVGLSFVAWWQVTLSMTKGMKAQ